MGKLHHGEAFLGHATLCCQPGGGAVYYQEQPQDASLQIPCSRLKPHFQRTNCGRCIQISSKLAGPPFANSFMMYLVLHIFHLNLKAFIRPWLLGHQKMPQSRDCSNRANKTGKKYGSSDCDQVRGFTRFTVVVRKTSLILFLEVLTLLRFQREL